MANPGNSDSNSLHEKLHGSFKRFDEFQENSEALLACDLTVEPSAIDNGKEYAKLMRLVVIVRVP